MSNYVDDSDLSSENSPLDDAEIRRVLGDFDSSVSGANSGGGSRRKAAVKRRDVSSSDAGSREKRESSMSDEAKESVTEDASSGFDGMAPPGQADDDFHDEFKAAEHVRPKPKSDARNDLGAFYEKWKVGVDPEISIRIQRVYPKIFPNGIMAEGPLEEHITPIDESYIASSFGGGRYEVWIMGPGKDGNGRRKYAQHLVTIPGEPNTDRPSKLVAARRSDSVEAKPALPVPVVSGAEPVGVTQQALKTLEKVSDQERQRAESLEQKLMQKLAASSNEASALAELVKKQADEKIALLREQNERERQAAEERIRERDAKINEIREEIRQMQNNGLGQVKEVLSILGPSQAAPQQMIESLLAKHAQEIEAMRAAHAREMESVRAAHLREIEIMREAHARDLDSERRVAADRERRLADEVAQAREERRRDQELARTVQEQRDQASRDREQMRVDALNDMWQSRLRSADESANFRINALQAEIERLRGEVSELRSKQREDGDVFSQIEKARSLIDMAKEVGGLGGEERVREEPIIRPEPQKSVVDQVVQAAPMVMETLEKFLGSDTKKKKRSAPQAAMPPLGSVVNTPQGRMVVTPQGLVPEMAYRQYITQTQQAQLQPPRMFSPPSPGMVPGQAQGRGQEQGQGARTSRPRKSALQTHSDAYIASPEKAEQAAVPTAPIQPAIPISSVPQDEVVVAASNIYEGQEQMEGAREPLSATAATFVAQAIDEGLNSALEVDEFIDRVRQRVPETYLQDLVKYSPVEILEAIGKHQPKSLALTPAGRVFTHRAFLKLRAMYGLA